MVPQRYIFVAGVLQVVPQAWMYDVRHAPTGTQNQKFVSGAASRDACFTVLLLPGPSHSRVRETDRRH